MRKLSWLAIFLAQLTLANSAISQVLHDIDFTPPDVGSYSIPEWSSPTVVSSFGTFTDAMLFQLTSGSDIEDMDLFWSTRGSGYTLDFDVFTQGLNDSLYAFVLYTGGGQVGLHGRLNDVEVFQTPSPYVWAPLQRFADGTPYHIKVSADFTANLWQVSVDDVLLYSNTSTSEGTGVRFRLAAWYQGAAYDPDVMVALDNIRVAVIPEPRTSVLSLVALLALCARQTRQF